MSLYWGMIWIQRLTTQRRAGKFRYLRRTLTIRLRLFSIRALACRSSGKPEEYCQGAVQSHDILIIQFADPLAEPRLRYGCNLVDHQPRRTRETVAIGGLNQHSQQRCVRRVSGECAQ